MSASTNGFVKNPMKELAEDEVLLDGLSCSELFAQTEGLTYK